MGHAVDPDVPKDNARWTDPFLPEEDERKAREMHERGFPSSADLEAERERRRAARGEPVGDMPDFDAGRDPPHEDGPGSDYQDEPDLPTPEHDLTPEQLQKRKAWAEQLTTRRAETYERKKAAEQERIKKAVAAQERRDRKDEGADDA